MSRQREYRGVYVDLGWCVEARNGDVPWPVRLWAYALCKSERSKLHVPFGPGVLAKDLGIDRSNLRRVIDRTIEWRLLADDSIPQCLHLPHTMVLVESRNPNLLPGEHCPYADEHRAAQKRRAWSPPRVKRPAPVIESARRFDAREAE